MNIFNSNTRALAALGHDSRLSIYRLLVKAGEQRLRGGDIAGHLEFAASTLAHYLSVLADAKLVIQGKKGREVFNRVDYQAVLGLSAFLISGCCEGVTLEAKEDAA